MVEHTHTTLFVQSDAIHKRDATTGSRSNLHSLFDANQRTNPGVAAAIPRWAETCIAQQQQQQQQQTDGTGTGAAHQDATQAKIEKLVHAVSADITESVLNQRRRYLEASGMEKGEIDADIEALTPTDNS